MKYMLFREPSREERRKAAKDPKKPPTFRGSDFAMRFEQGRWSEDRLIEGINNTRSFRAIPYGRSQVGPEDKAKIKAYWAEYVAAEAHGKRPDILVLRRRDYDWARRKLGDDPTIAPDDVAAEVVERAVCGIEAENSLWVGREMKDFASSPPLRTKNPKCPNIWVKEQDLPGLKAWMYHYQKPIVVAQVFYDVAYAVELSWVVDTVRKIAAADVAKRAELSKRVGVFIREQAYPDQRTGIPVTKTVYVTHHACATLFGELTGKVQTDAKVIFEPGGKILPYVAFKGGTLRITNEGEAFLRRLAR